MGFFSGHLWQWEHAKAAVLTAMWVPCGCDDVKADHLAPSHLRAAASALARSSGVRSASASSSIGSPLPAVFATRCHLRPSILSIGAPCPLTSTRARRVLGGGAFFFGGLGDNAPPGAPFFWGAGRVLKARAG